MIKMNDKYDKYIKEYEEMNYYDLADELVEPLFSVKQNEAKTIYVHYAKERDKNEQLQNNWNELKSWLEEETKENDITIKKCDQVIFKMGNENRNDTHQHKLIDVCSRENLVFKRILNKMQELEQGKDE